MTDTQAAIGFILLAIGGILVIWYCCTRTLGPKPQPREDLRPPLDPQAMQIALGERRNFPPVKTPPAPPPPLRPEQGELDKALAKCRETYIGPGPCYTKPYLEARREYHKLLAEVGHISTQQNPASKKPLTKTPKRVSAKTPRNARD